MFNRDMTPNIDIGQYDEVFGIKQMPFLYSEIFSQHYRKLGCLLVFAGGQWTCYLPQKVIQKTLRDGLRFLKNTKRLLRYERDFRQSAAATTGFFRTLAQQRMLSSRELARARYLAGRVFRYYIWTEFFYTDLAYLRSRDDAVLRKNLRRLGRIKNWGRAYLNNIYLGKRCSMALVLSTVSRQFRMPVHDLVQYNLKEALELFENRRVDRATLQARRRAYVMLAREKTLQTWEGKEAAIFARRIRREVARGRSLLKGTPANPGRVRGTVKVIDVGYENFDAVHHAIRRMKRGQILVANTTSPEIMAACRKAAAIITNEGGLLSHAAIISRELGIPCVVGTRHATEVLKDGNLVEVDAEKGVIRKLKT